MYISEKETKMPFEEQKQSKKSEAWLKHNSGLVTGFTDARADLE